VNELDEGRTQRFFDRFYGISLGTNLLIGEHLALHDEGVNLVQKICPFQVAEKAMNDARSVCEKHFGRTVPEIKIISKDPSIHTTYISEHLHRILFEVLKNSLRATIDTHAASSTLPPLKVIIANGGEDVSIKVSDEGGGIPISKMSRIWSYKMISGDGDRFSDAGEVKDYLELPLAGFGHGLPVARLTARYFGGDLNLVSMEGYGTDTYVSLSRDSSYPENFPENPVIKRTLGMEFIDMQRDEPLRPEVVRSGVEMDLINEQVMDRIATLSV
jgi:pyruvate dehydrogenase kinase 2/3/4